MLDTYLEALRREYFWCAKNNDGKSLIFTVSSFFFSYSSSGLPCILHLCVDGSSWVPVYIWKHICTCMHMKIQVVENTEGQ